MGHSISCLLRRSCSVHSLHD